MGRARPVDAEPRTLGDIAEKYGVTVAEAARCYPFAPGVGAVPITPAPPVVRRVETPRPQLSLEEAQALLDEFELYSKRRVERDEDGEQVMFFVDRDRSVRLTSALDKLRRLAVP